MLAARGSDVALTYRRNQAAATDVPRAEAAGRRSRPRSTSSTPTAGEFLDDVDARYGASTPWCTLRGPTCRRSTSARSRRPSSVPSSRRRRWRSSTSCSPATAAHHRGQHRRGDHRRHPALPGARRAVGRPQGLDRDARARSPPRRALRRARQLRGPGDAHRRDGGAHGVGRPRRGNPRDHPAQRRARRFGTRSTWPRRCASSPPIGPPTSPGSTSRSTAAASERPATAPFAGRGTTVTREARARRTRGETVAMHRPPRVADWAGSDAGIGLGVADLARTAEAVGVRTLSFMDHWFQMEAMAPAEDPMLEGYTALGFVAGRTDRLRLRLLVTGVTYRHPGLLAKTVTTLDVVSGGRAELGSVPRYEREHRGSASWPAGRRALRAARGGDPDLPADVERRRRPLRGHALPAGGDAVPAGAGEHAAPCVMIGGTGPRKTLRPSPATPTCNFFGGPDGRRDHRPPAPPLRHRRAGHRRHRGDGAALRCTTGDDVLRAAEQFAPVGVDTVVVGARRGPRGGWRRRAAR